MELCQQSEWAWKRTKAPDENIAQLTPQLWPCITLTKEARYTMTKFLTCKNCEIINRCSFKLLCLGDLLHSNRKLIQETPNLNRFYLSMYL